MKKKILFISLHHRKRDPRLFYREVRLLKENIPEREVYIVTKKSVEDQEQVVISTQEILKINDHQVYNIIIQYKKLDRYNVLAKLFLKLYIGFFYIKTCVDFKFETIQASDARELLSTLIIGVLSKSRLIYDSHEDYVRQILDFKSKSINNYFTAFKLFMYEILLIRFYDAVFCTDEYLFEKYQKKIFASKAVNILRNYPYIENNQNLNNYQEKNVLKLVYIGGVNEYRGVIECAKYVDRFNSENCSRKLKFDVYSPVNDITEKLKKEKLINHIEWIDYRDLMFLLRSSYDVGICLWHPIKKFYRNLPLKNFDYMGSSLPIITSNFGNLKVHMDKSMAGICIDPLSYEEFKQAIDIMFKPERRKEYSYNGRMYAKNKASFQSEGKAYLDLFMKDLVR